MLWVNFVTFCRPEFGFTTYWFYCEETYIRPKCTWFSLSFCYVTSFPQ